MAYVVVRYIGGPLHGQFERRPSVQAVAGAWCLFPRLTFQPLSGNPGDPSMPPPLLDEHRYLSLGPGSRGAVVMVYFGLRGMADFAFPNQRRGDVAQ